MNGASLSRSRGRSPGRQTARGVGRRVGRQNAAIRYAAATAERYLDSQEPPEWTEDRSIADDAPTVDQMPEWILDNTDDTILGDDADDVKSGPASYMPWVRLSIYASGGNIAFQVHVPVTDDPGIQQSLKHLRDGWAKTAQALIATHPRALLSHTPLEALRVMGSYPMKELERSAGQGSRDKRVVIATPFGLAPLWFFAQGRKDNLFDDLVEVGAALLAERPDRLTASTISQIIRRPSVQPDSIRRAHGEALLAVVHQPDVVARHRSLWPLTTPQDLLDDLGVTSKVGRSAPVATLCLVGAFDPPRQLTARSVGRLNPGVKS